MGSARLGRLELVMDSIGATLPVIALALGRFVRMGSALWAAGAASCRSARRLGRSWASGSLQPRSHVGQGCPA
eukprot:2493480-Alexandrium_andersonii.AAC.1